MEEWKDIGYEGLYQVSNFGRVKSLERVISGKKYKEKILTCRNKHGYPVVALCKDGAHKFVRVHRIVAQTFIENPLSLPEVNHLDGNKNNNRVTNLEWCTGRDNKIHAWVTGLAKKPKPISKKPVEQLVGNKVIATYVAIVIAAEINRLDEGSICDCCRGKRQTVGGYGWRYKEDANDD